MRSRRRVPVADCRSGIRSSRSLTRSTRLMDRDPEFQGIEVKIDGDAVRPAQVGRLQARVARLHRQDAIAGRDQLAPTRLPCRRLPVVLDR